MKPDPVNLSAGLNQNFQIFRGESKELVVDTTGYDLTSATDIEWWMATSAFADVAMARKDLVSGISLSGAQLTIELDQADTDFAPDLYYHELKVTSPTGMQVIMIGNVVIRMSLEMETVP
jgi:hypothetical protein